MVKRINRSLGPGPAEDDDVGDSTAVVDFGRNLIECDRCEEREHSQPAFEVAHLSPGD